MVHCGPSGLFDLLSRSFLSSVYPIASLSVRFSATYLAIYSTYPLYHSLYSFSLLSSLYSGSLFRTQPSITTIIDCSKSTWLTSPSSESPGYYYPHLDIEIFISSTNHIQEIKQMRNESDLCMSTVCLSVASN